MQQVLIHQNLLETLDFDKLKNALNDLSNLKSKVDKLYNDKLAPVSVDLSKLSNLVKNDDIKKGGCI